MDQNERVGKSMGFMDVANTQELMARKVSDITGDCRKKPHSCGKVLVIFGQGTDGVMAQILCAYESGDDGPYMTFATSRLDCEEFVDQAPFVGLAKSFGLTTEELADLIRREKPPLDREKLVRDLRAYSACADSKFEPCMRRAGVRIEELIRID